MAFGSSIVLALALGVLASADTTEYVAFVQPNSDATVTWKQVTYPSNYTATSASEVTMTDVSETVSELGAWQDLQFGGSPMLTARTFQGVIYGQLLVESSTPSGDGYPGGCCADTMRGIDKETGAQTDVRLDYIMNEIFDGVANTDSSTGLPWAYANHVFDMTEINGHPVALVDVAYGEPLLGSALVDAVVAVDMSTGSLLQTADGDNFFSFYQKLGTTSTDMADGIYKIQYYSTTQEEDEFHQNGITRFVSNDGTAVLAVTHKNHGEAILMKCPYTYTSSEGGGSILQRFGSPFHYSGSSKSGTHTFGLSTGDGAITALHNIHHTKYPDGRETMTVFVNEQTGYSVNRVFEFDVKLTAEANVTSVDDTVFDTSYVTASLSYSEETWGGARPVGNGVWLVGRDDILAVDSSSWTSKEPLNKTAAAATAASGSRRSLLQGPPPPMDDDGSGPSGGSSVYDSFVNLLV